MLKSVSRSSSLGLQDLSKGISKFLVRCASTAPVTSSFSTYPAGTDYKVGQFENLSFAQSPETFESVLDGFAKHRATAVLRTPTSEACPLAMQAAIDGGFKICEFTLTTPDAMIHMHDFKQKYAGTDIMIGMGTIMNVQDAEMAVEGGAEFIITPVFIPDVVMWCRDNNIVIVPGCQTPTEAYNAYLHGAPLQKIFPGVAGGANWIGAVSKALPMLRLNPTSGVDITNAGEFLKAGAASVGLVAPLFTPEAIANGDWEQIEKNARVCIDSVEEVGPLVRS